MHREDRGGFSVRALQVWEMGTAQAEAEGRKVCGVAGGRHVLTRLNVMKTWRALLQFWTIAIQKCTSDSKMVSDKGVLLCRFSCRNICVVLPSTVLSTSSVVETPFRWGWGGLGCLLPGTDDNLCIVSEPVQSHTSLKLWPNTALRSKQEGPCPALF